MHRENQEAKKLEQFIPLPPGNGNGVCCLGELGSYRMESSNATGVFRRKQFSWKMVKTLKRCSPQNTLVNVGATLEECLLTGDSTCRAAVAAKNNHCKITPTIAHDHKFYA